MESERTEALISRVADGSFSEADWTELELLGRGDPSVWEQLATGLRVEARLRAAVDRGVGRAEWVELPRLEAPGRRRLARAHGWGGWLAALLILGLWGWWFIAAPGSGSRTALPSAEALTPDTAYRRYLTLGHREGRVLRELPSLMVEAVPDADGKAVQVVYVRRVLERANINHVYELGRDDSGRPTPVPASWERFASSGPQ